MSKTKIGATLVGVGVVFGIVGNYFLGSPVTVDVLSKLFEAVGVVVGVWGVRDWPIINNY